jgi:hypothetical protein
MTVYELLDLLIAELDQLRADNRRLNLELDQLRADNRRLNFEVALDQLRADNRRLNLELAAARSQRDNCSSASPHVGVTGRPELWCGGPSNYSDAD